MDYTRSELILNLVEILIGAGGQTKYQLQKNLLETAEIDASTSEINSALYSQRKIFRRDDSTLPHWWLTFDDESTIETIPSSPTAITTDISPIYQGPKPREWQLEAFDAWCKAGKRGVIEAVTGTGKTTVGVIATADAAENGFGTLVLVPGLDLMRQWLDKLSKDLPNLSIGQFGGGRKDSFGYHHVIVATVQSVSRTPISPATSDGLLIADEVHRYGTEKFARALNENFSHRLGLTATYERQDHGIEQFLHPYFISSQGFDESLEEIVAGCSYARGLADGILAPFKVGLVPVRFTYQEQESYKELDGKARRWRNKLIHNHGCPSEPFGEFIKAVGELSKGNNDDSQGTGLARGYLDVFTKRKKLLAESHHKLQALNTLVPLLGVAHNGIVFTNTKKSAETAAEILQKSGIPAMDYTSDLNQDDRKLRLAKFRSGKIRVLAAPRVLDEGIDVPEADVGIIVAANSSRRQMIQRMGRIIRPKSDGRTATFIILYVEDTSEDPNRGAHGVFIGEMMDTAQEVKYFKANVDPQKLLHWYSAN